MKMKTGVRQLRMALLGLSAAAMLAAAPAYAQLSTATIQGHVTQGGSAGAATQIVATNTANGYSFRTTSNADGSYVLTGLPPGVYQIQVAGRKSDPVTLSIGQTASVDLTIGTPDAAAAGDMQRVVITGNAERRAVRSSEVGTSVSRKQIESLPQNSRNFLAFADLAPGVRFDTDSQTGYVKLQSGAQNQDNVNVFIDGVGQKNYILRGGVSGLDASRGNPFPQSAVAEYRVITQNYKAEFDQVSSAAITAITKSGTNQFHGDVFYDYTSDSLVAYDPFQKKNERAGVKRPAYKQNQHGVTLGGPLIKDVAHFFIAYEGKDISTPRQVVLQNDNLLPNAGKVPSLRARAGASTSNFKEDLVLAKIDAQLSEEQYVEISTRIRRESDFVPEDFRLSLPGNDKDRKNDETRFDLRHEWTRGQFRNELRASYENYKWNPRGRLGGPYIKYKVSPSNTYNNLLDVINDGGSPDFQNREQTGLSLQEDLTWSGLAGHTIKGGVKFKRVEFDLSGTPRAVDIRTEMIHNVTGIPELVRVEEALAPVSVKYKDNQFGIYLQDDWKVSQKLEVNAGVRWDYEDNMLNDSYVTPADRVAIFGKQDPRGAPAGQTYAQSLAKGGVVISDYISTGSNRKAFTGALQPRVGFSYDLKGNGDSVIFGGYGRAYDRAMANHSLDEVQKNAVPNVGEIWLIKSDHKLPYTDQFSLGLRQALVGWNTELGYTHSRSRNQFNWFGGNRDINGGWGTQSPIDPLWGSVDPYGTLILGDFVSQARTQSLYLKADKPYSTASGWGLSATYTLSDGETTNKEWTNDIFNWTYGRSTSGWHPSTDVERHRLVVAGLTDRLLPWGIMTSSKVTLGSGLPYRITDCSDGWNQCMSQKGDGGFFRQVDVAASKDVSVGFGRVSLRMDVLNVFNTTNYGGYESWGGGPGNPQNYLGGDNPNLGMVTGVRGPMRTVKFTARYAF